MTEKLKAAWSKVCELRAKLNALPQDAAAETRAAAEGDLSAADGVLQTILQAEPVSTPSPEDSEARERRELRGRVQVADHVSAAMESRGLDGAALEFNQALGLRATGAFPLELLAPEVEERATTNVNSQVTQRPWLDRLFSDTAAMRLGITFESVPAGAASFPLVKTGPSAAQRGRKEAAADAPWTVGVKDLKPTRNSVRAIFSEEDAMRLPGLEQALRRDLAMALTEGTDRVVFVGDTTANENAGDIAGLNTLADVTEKEISQASKIKGPETLTAFAELVDGKHSNGLEDLRVVASVGANALWLVTKVSGNNAEIQTMSQFLRGVGLSWTVRGDIEAATSAGKFGAFLGRGRGLMGAGVAAVWNSGLLIRDPYSQAAKGEVALTLSYFWNFGLPRPSNFARIKFIAG